MSIDLGFLDDIRDAVNSPQSADPDLLREASTAYNEACRNVNTRLREVDKLLRHGLRNEAIQLAEQEPPLMELVADLEFPLLEEWQGMLAQLGMQLPAQLERDIAARLNAAYGELQPLEQLMRRHRLLALARAPLAARIEVLRKICDRDEMNLSWNPDLIAYETQRLRQIRSEATDAGRHGDLATLADLHSELTGSVWMCEVPQDVLREVAALHENALQCDARQLLEQMVPELDQAYSEFDFDRATELADRWAELSQSAQLAAADPLAMRVCEALEWVHQQRQQVADQHAFQQCLQTLEDALEQYTPAQKLESRFRKAERYGFPIPEMLRNRVAERLDVLRTQSRRRSLVIGSAATLLVVILTAAVFYHWHNVRNQELVAEHVDNLTSLVDEGQWERALAYFVRLPSTMQHSPQLMELNSKSKEGLRAEEERSATVEKLLGRAEEMDPSSPDYDLIGDIKQQIKTDHERRRLDEVESTVRRHQREQQKTTDEAFLSTVNHWSRRLADLESQASLDDVDLRELLPQLRTELNQHQRVTASLKSRSEPLASKIRALIRQKDGAIDERNALQVLSRAVSHRTEYVAAIERLANSRSNTTAAAHARQVLDDKDAWLSVIQWAEFWESHQDTWRDLTPDAAEDVLKAGTALQADTLKNELGFAFEERKPHLESLVSRKDVDLTKLKSLLIQNTLMNGVWMVIDGRGRLYSPKEPVETAARGQLQFEYFTDYSTVKRVTRTDVKWYGRAPQSVCADRFAVNMAELKASNWDSVFGKMAVTVREQTKENPPLDEVLATDMLRSILTTGSEGSFAFQKAFSAVVNEIENSGVDLSVAWFLPGDADAEAARRDARALIHGLPDFRVVAQRLSELQRAHSLPPKDRFRWVAALERGPGNTWRCQPDPGPHVNGTLLVATKGSPDSVRLSQVAEVHSGKVTWRTNNDRAPLLTGAPLFLRTSQSDSP